LTIENQSGHGFKIKVTEISNYDWDGVSRPDHNFEGVNIPNGQSVKNREELNSNANGSWFRMTLALDNGDVISFRANQYEAFKGHDRDFGLNGP
jgi:hypothetical protein